MCDICGKIFEHDCRCPYYIPPRSDYICSICGEGIYNGEKYLENCNEEYVHYTCLEWVPDFMDWIDCNIKTMEE